MTKPMEEISWQEVEACRGVVTEPGNASCYHTGTWRSQRPIYAEDTCIRCQRCFVVCPDASVAPDFANNRMTWNLDYCKGCGICAYECPVKAIHMVEETS